ncbi:MAG: hypothetical protein ACE365_07945 [Gammaproteobacteria bacterium]
MITSRSKSNSVDLAQPMNEEVSTPRRETTDHSDLIKSPSHKETKGFGIAEYMLHKVYEKDYPDLDENKKKLVLWINYFLYEFLIDIDENKDDDDCENEISKLVEHIQIQLEYFLLGHLWYREMYKSIVGYIYDNAGELEHFIDLWRQIKSFFIPLLDSYLDKFENEEKPPSITDERTSSMSSSSVEEIEEEKEAQETKENTILQSKKSQAKEINESKEPEMETQRPIEANEEKESETTFDVIKEIFEWDQCGDFLFYHYELLANREIKNNVYLEKLNTESKFFQMLQDDFGKYPGTQREYATFSYRQDRDLDAKYASQSQTKSSFELLPRLNEAFDDIAFDPSTFADLLIDKPFGYSMSEDAKVIDPNEINIYQLTKIGSLMMHAWKCACEHPAEQILLVVTDNNAEIINRLKNALSNNGLEHLIPSNVTLQLRIHNLKTEYRNQDMEDEVDQSLESEYLFSGKGRFCFVNEEALRANLRALFQQSDIINNLYESRDFNFAIASLLFNEIELTNTSLSQNDSQILDPGLIYKSKLQKNEKNLEPFLSNSNPSANLYSYYAYEALAEHERNYPNLSRKDKELILHTYNYLHQFDTHAAQLEERENSRLFSIIKNEPAAEALKNLSSAIEGNLNNYLSGTITSENFHTYVKDAITTQRPTLINHRSIWTKIVKGFWEPLRMLLNTVSRSDFFKPIRTESRKLTLDFQEDLDKLRNNHAAQGV